MCHNNVCDHVFSIVTRNIIPVLQCDATAMRQRCDTVSDAPATRRRRAGDELAMSWRLCVARLTLLSNVLAHTIIPLLGKIVTTVRAIKVIFAVKKRMPIVT